MVFSSIFIGQKRAIEVSKRFRITSKDSIFIIQRIKKAMLGAKSPLLQGIEEMMKHIAEENQDIGMQYNKRGRGTKKAMVVE